LQESRQPADAGRASQVTRTLDLYYVRIQ